MREFEALRRSAEKPPLAQLRVKVYLAEPEYTAGIEKSWVE
jgi:hypothetical protein